MRFASWAIGIALTLAAGSVHAAPQDLFGFGTRSSGMGMTSAASAEDYEAIYGNPGLLAETRDKSLTLGLGIARHALRADTPSQSLTLPTDEMRTIYIGAALPIPFGGALKDRVTFGVGFLDPVKVLVRGKILYPERLQYPLLAPRVQSIAVTMGVGVRLGDRFYVGGGFEALAGVVGQILIQMDATGRVGSRTDDQVVAAYAPIFGAAADLGESWRLGLTYRGELIGRFAILIRAQDLGINLPDFNVAGVAQYIPEQIAFEARWSSTGRTPVTASSNATRISGGLLIRRWSRYPGPVEPTVLENQDFGTGSPELEEKRKGGSFASDTISPRIGIERAIRMTAQSGFRLRAGYAFEPTPLPKQHGPENLLDSSRHVLTAGAGIVGDPSLPFSIDIFGQLHILQTRTNEKDNGDPTVTAGGTIVVVGATVGVKF
ncbi:MAG: OmpP1/FadL family transporter [Polyangiales bacterium]